MHRHVIIQLVRSGTAGTATTAANQAGPLQHSLAPSSLRLHAWTEIAPFSLNMALRRAGLQQLCSGKHWRFSHLQSAVRRSDSFSCEDRANVHQDPVAPDVVARPLCRSRRPGFLCIGYDGHCPLGPSGQGTASAPWYRLLDGQPAALWLQMPAVLTCSSHWTICCDKQDGFLKQGFPLMVDANIQWDLDKAIAAALGSGSLGRVLAGRVIPDA